MVVDVPNGAGRRARARPDPPAPGRECRSSMAWRAAASRSPSPSAPGKIGGYSASQCRGRCRGRRSTPAPSDGVGLSNVRERLAARLRRRGKLQLWTARRRRLPGRASNSVADSMPEPASGHLIVDDEPLAIERLQILCARIAGVSLVGTATDGAGALRLIEGLEAGPGAAGHPDGGHDGMAVAQALAKALDRAAGGDLRHRLRPFRRGGVRCRGRGLSAEAGGDGSGWNAPLARIQMHSCGAATPARPARRAGPGNSGCPIARK